MFFRDDSNRGETLTKGQRGYISDIIAEELKQCECSGDLLKAMDELFDIYKEVNDGGQADRLKGEELETIEETKFDR